MGPLTAESEHPLGSYLAELADATPSAANIVEYAKIVKEQADRRSLIDLTGDIRQRAQAGEPLAPLRERFLHRAANLADPLQDVGAQPCDVTPSTRGPY